MRSLTMYRLNGSNGRTPDPAASFVATNDDGEPLARMIRRRGTGDSGMALFQGRESSHQPEYKKFLEDAFGSLTIPRLKRASLVLIVTFRLRGARAYYALPFGNGFSLLNDEKIDAAASIKAALNAIMEGNSANPQVSSVRSRTVSTNPQRVRRDSNRPTHIFDYNFDINSDSLSGLSGKADKDKVGSSVSANVALQVRGQEYTMDNLLDLLVEIEEYVRRDPTAFGRALLEGSAVRDADTLNTLDNALVEQIKSEDGDVSLVSPEDLEGDVRYHFVGLGSAHDDHKLDIAGYRVALSSSEKLQSLTVVDLKKARVAYFFDGKERRKMLARCMHASVQLGETVYIFDEGQWRVFSDHLIGNIRLDISKISEVAQLSPWPANQDEALYNAAQASDHVLNLDRNLAKGREFPKGVEFADLVRINDDTLELIHVKKGIRGQDLSHLFAQGLVSANSLADPDFCRKVLDVANDAGFDLSRFIGEDGVVDPSMIRVVFGIGHSWPPDRNIGDVLTTIGLMGMNTAAKGIRLRGFDVGIIRIPRIAQAAPPKNRRKTKDAKSAGVAALTFHRAVAAA